MVNAPPNTNDCRHCGLPVPDAIADGFCCPGCAAAYHLVQGLGLDRYYEQRAIDPDERPLRPDDAPGITTDFTAYVQTNNADVNTLHLMVGGLHCAACVWLIESVLTRQAHVTHARLNMTTRRLVLRWSGAAALANDLIGLITGLGYRLAPYDPAQLTADHEAEQKALLRATAVAGFAAGNVMLLSISVWSGQGDDMGPAARGLLHWLSALIALPAVTYAGRHFFRSALGALRARAVNMDVPISLALILTAGLSLFETIRGSEHVYFDSVLTLCFFLLLGRYFDRRARGRARAVGEHLLALSATAATVIQADGSRRVIPTTETKPGMTLLCAMGERIAADGQVIDGASELDQSLITGETMPHPVSEGDPVQAGTLNLSAALQVRVTATGEDTVLAGIVALMEDAEQSRSTYVALADRVARLYAPAVHGLALITFVGWMALADATWQTALLHAVAVLIITCPCALALAVPAVQVVAAGRLFKRGILLKSGTALERLAAVDKVVFDKTGTLTLGRPELINNPAPDPDALRFAAAMASASHHPLSKALVRAAPTASLAQGVREVPGQGLALTTKTGEAKLGSQTWCDIASTPGQSPTGPTLWLARPGHAPQMFAFRDAPRPHAAATVQQLTQQGFAPELSSGDAEGVVRALAHELGIETWAAQVLPADKSQRLHDLAKLGQHPLMVGDGLNDAPALASAWVSMSPSSAADLAQNAADVVFQSDALTPVAETITIARRAMALVRQNIGFSLLYNSVTIPLAMAGYATPLVAALAMSTSSLVVIANALRLANTRAS